MRNSEYVFLNFFNNIKCVNGQSNTVVAAFLSLFINKPSKHTIYSLFSPQF